MNGATGVTLSVDYEQALEWLVRLHDGSAQEADWEAYLHWKDATATRREAAERAERLWFGLGSALRPQQRPQRKLAGLLGVLLVVGLALLPLRDDGWLADQRTAAAEQRLLRLDDGSQLQLAPRTRLDIAMDAERRCLQLYRGELHVRVAADPQRPFVVEAGAVRVEALGTAFDVRRQGERVRVVVDEHAVRVSYPGANGLVVQTVQAGQQLELPASSPGIGAALLAVPVERVTAWRQQRLVFDRRPLSEVVEGLADYQAGVIWIRDDSVRQLPVTAVLDTRDVSAQLDSLAAALPIRVRRLPGLSLIEAAPDS